MEPGYFSDELGHVCSAGSGTGRSWHYRRLPGMHGGIRRSGSIAPDVTSSMLTHGTRRERRNAGSTAPRKPFFADRANDSAPWRDDSVLASIRNGLRRHEPVAQALLAYLAISRQRQASRCVQKSSTIG